MSIKWRHQFDDDTDRELRELTDVFCLDESKTVQSFAQDCDINVLVKRFGITDGAVPPVALDPRFFGDFSDALDFRESWDAVRVAEERFGQLPAELRERFGNDPLRLWDFVNNPQNEEKAIELGLLAKSQPVPAPKVDDPRPPAV